MCERWGVVEEITCGYWKFFIITLKWAVQQSLLERKYQRQAFTHKCWADLWPETFCKGTNKIVLVSAHYLEYTCMYVCDKLLLIPPRLQTVKDAGVKSFLKDCSVSSHLTPHPKKQKFDKRKQVAVRKRACPANDIG